MASTSERKPRIFEVILIIFFSSFYSARGVGGAVSYSPVRDASSIFAQAVFQGGPSE